MRRRDNVGELAPVLVRGATALAMERAKVVDVKYIHTSIRTMLEYLMVAFLPRARRSSTAAQKKGGNGRMARESRFLGSCGAIEDASDAS
jgi:hypothetical protein